LKSKKIILITIIALIGLCVLAWVIFRAGNLETVLQSSTYIEMFEPEDIGHDMNLMAHGIVENMTLDIVRISNETNGIATATINITIPDVASALIETMESFPNMENIDEATFENRFTSNMQNHFITLRKEFEVIQQGWAWRVSNREDIDNLIDEQQTAMFIRLLEYSEFEQITLPTF